MTRILHLATLRPDPIAIGLRNAFPLQNDLTPDLTSALVRLRLLDDRLGPVRRARTAPRRAAG